MCYHAEFGRSTSNGVGLNRGEPKNWRDAGAPTAWDGAWLTLKANPLKLAVSYTVVAVASRPLGQVGPWPDLKYAKSGQVGPDQDWSGQARFIF